MEDFVETKELGKGTSGIVILAYCKSLSKQVVIKSIPVRGMDSVQKSDAMTEVNVLRQLEHPFIVTHYKHFIDEKSLSIVMQWADGGDLDSFLKKMRVRNTRIPEAQILKWFSQLVLGLAYIHSRNIMHRDLKPQNLFLTSDGERMLIGDFGVCKVLNKRSDLTSTITGTPYYLSPEIFQNRPYSMKSDIWSLGCVLYEIAALHVPFDAVDMRALCAKVTRGSNPIFPQIYSKEVRDIFSELLRRDHRSRPSAVDLLAKPIVENALLSMMNCVDSQTREKLIAAIPKESLLTRKLFSKQGGINSSSPRPPLYVAPSARARSTSTAAARRGASAASSRSSSQYVGNPSTYWQNQLRSPSILRTARSASPGGRLVPPPTVRKGSESPAVDKENVGRPLRVKEKEKTAVGSGNMSGRLPAPVLKPCNRQLVKVPLATKNLISQKDKARCSQVRN